MQYPITIEAFEANSPNFAALYVLILGLDPPIEREILSNSPIFLRGESLKEFR